MGTTSEKLTYLNTTKTLIKEELNLGGANITNEPFRAYKGKLEGIYKDFLANGTDTLWNNWEKVTGTGETITLNNTIEAKMDFVYKGNTSQTGTPTPDTPQDIQVVSGDNTIKVEGKNLCNNDNILGLFLNYTNSTIGETDGSKTMYAKIPKNTDITISRATLTNRFRIGLLNKIPQSGDTFYLAYNGDGSSNLSKTINSGNYEYVAVQYTNQGENTNIQIEKGSTASSYQPYQSATYPISLGNIELCKIGDYQDKIAKSTGKNLFDKDTATLNKYLDTNGNLQNSTVSGVSDYIDVRKYDNVYINYTGTNTSQKNYCYYDENQDFITYGSYTNGGKNLNVSNYSYIRITYLMADNNMLMVNEGTTALPYEPYGKVWYLNKQIGKVVLNGSETFWETFENASTGNTRLFGVNDYDNIPREAYIGLSNYFTNSSSTIWSVDYEAMTVNNTGTSQIRFRINKTIADSIEAFTTWLSTHNTIVYYILATPTNEEITDTTLIYQLEATKKSYNNQTNISQENSKEAFILDVTALGN